MLRRGKLVVEPLTCCASTTNAFSAAQHNHPERRLGLIQPDLSTLYVFTRRNTASNATDPLDINSNGAMLPVFGLLALVLAPTSLLLVPLYLHQQGLITLPNLNLNLPYFGHQNVTWPDPPAKPATKGGDVRRCNRPQRYPHANAIAVRVFHPHQSRRRSDHQCAGWQSRHSDPGAHRR